MAQQLSVVSLADRTNQIQQAQATGRTLAVRFRSRTIDLPRKRIPLGTPIYRMRNIRTIVVQESYVADHHLADDFFNNGQEDVSAQRAQDELLLQLAKESKANIYAHLERSKEQTEPLIVTVAGVVLNGNRRLAAVRDLYSRDSQEFRAFEHVEVAVLPPEANEDDLAQLETDLQIAPDYRLDYGWVEEARGLRYQLEVLKWDMAKAQQHWQSGKEELNRRLSQLAAAEEYLERIGKPKRYELVKDDDLALQALLRSQSPKARGNESPARIKAEKLVVFALMQHKGSLSEGRVYGHAGEAKAILDKMLQSGAIPGGDGTPDSPIATTDPQPVAEPAADDDPLGALPEQGNPVPDAVLDFLGDTQNWETIAAAADDAFGELKDAKKQTQRTSRFSMDSGKINAMATGLTLTNADPSTLGTASAQLVSALKEIAERLQQIARDYPAAAAELDRDRIAQAKGALEVLLHDQ